MKYVGMQKNLNNLEKKLENTRFYRFFLVATIYKLE